jgi:hypothetical protein
MFALLLSLAIFVVDLFKSRRRLVAENLFLRHQLSIALRRTPPRLRLRGSDRALLVWMTRLWPSLLGAARVYNEVRTHLALGKDAPLGRAVQRSGAIVAIPILSGLHHHYVRI